ncbi:hypothetical protein BDW02DRAFT_229015 [Decorospora gaudefroyi]|uniref:Protein prenylyltransferase n=1 Tax=Decorospora gaudefroyi TaxID=184978 RepID=A0A6A5KSF0_9PLEO|nr:hypothetical protein BDW02DRAFT_229015 [Decorospora gaudefroyi]
MASGDSQKTELQKRAYESLSKYFQEHEDEVIEIEILPPAIQPPEGVLMQDGLSLGVPKKVLALAYLEARQRFFDNRTSGLSSPIAKTLQATKIMLLFDPEHLTAANFRKRVLSHLEAGYGLYAETPYHQALRQELCFLNSVLTSPLHRQSKSPTLWYHRSGIVDSLVLIEFSGASDDQKAAFWRGELTAVFKSGEQHPKNYHAWQYARRLMHKIENLGSDEDFAHRVKDWCCRHPSDVSGWSFLLYLTARLQSTSSRHDLVADVVNYAITLGSEQESLWVFIRTVLAQEMLIEKHTALYQTLQNYGKSLETASKRPEISARVHSALTWIETHRPATVINTPGLAR